MNLPHDRDGFLIGTPTEIDTRSTERVLEVLRSLKADTSAMLNAMRGRGRLGVVAPQRERAPVRAQGVGTSSTQRVARGPQGSAALVQTVRATPMRDEKGRFIRAPAAAVNLRGDRAGGGGANGVSSPASDDAGIGGDGRIRKLAAAIGESIRTNVGTAAQGADQLDPAIGAMKEVRDLAAPITGMGKSAGAGLLGRWRDRQERKKRQLDAKENAKESIKAQLPWYRRILKALGSVGGEGGGLGGLLSSLLPSVGGLGGMLGRGGLFSGALAGLRGAGVGTAARVAGKSILPLGAIMSALDSFNTSTETYAKRYGVTEGRSIIRDVFVRFLGVFQDLGNTLTFGLADRLGNWMSGAGFNRSAPDAKPKVGANSAPVGSGSGSAGSAGLPPVTGGLSRDDLHARQMHAESGGDPNAKSRVGARGLMQLMPGTAREWEGKLGLPAGATDRDPAANERVGRAYMDSLLTRYGGDQRKALAAYNWGMGRVDKWNGSMATLPRETQGYLTKILGPQAASAVVPPITATSARPAAAAITGLPQASTGVAPSPPAPVPPPPSVPQHVGSNGRGKDPVEVIIPERVGQNVSDRGIAQLVTGGMGGGIGGRVA